jgi:hypothetical protein
MLDCCTASRARLDSTEGSDTDAAMADPRNSGNPTTSLARFDDSLVTTTFELPGFRITRNLGVVRGITVRSRSIVGNFQLGANAIIGMRYDATDVMTGLTEVLCYGTAVVVEPLR